MKKLEELTKEERKSLLEDFKSFCSGKELKEWSFFLEEGETEGKDPEFLKQCFEALGLSIEKAPATNG